jgi:hypothetical protein
MSQIDQKLYCMLSLRAYASVNEGFEQDITQLFDPFFRSEFLDSY